MKYLVLIAALAAPAALAECDINNVANQPAVPNGATATFEDMAAARSSVLQFTQAAQALASCDGIADFYHDYLVSAAEKSAAQFNNEREQFLRANRIAQAD